MLRRVLWALSPALACSPATGQTTPIAHVIFVMQENRSFDSYFGAFPGANGPRPGTCVPIVPGQPRSGCVAPFHDVHDVNSGGPHRNTDAQADLDDGISQALNDGFVAQQLAGQSGGSCKTNPNDPRCSALGPGVFRHDVMGYHTAEEIPNYWAYAQNFVLQDAMFEGVRSWSLPAHLQLVSEWVATCTQPHNAQSCTTANDLPLNAQTGPFPWVNLFQLLDLHQVSWRYYLAAGVEPDCEDGSMTCPPVTQQKDVPSIWNPAPNFTYVHGQGSAYADQHITPVAQFAADVQHGTLPAVSWIVPDQDYSEHPPAAISTGMEYVTSIVNAVMQSPYWQDTAIFITWDDWGGFYDHAVPPIADRNASSTPIQGFGLRVPGLLISAYAKPGFVDHATYSTDSFARLIEDLFMNSARLDPNQLGNPDARPDVRDALTQVQTMDGTPVPLGDLLSEFDFTKPPRPPLVLSTEIPTRIATSCNVNAHYVCQSRNVTISWTAVPRPGVTYHVQRDGSPLPGCSGTITICTDTPASGAHFYRAYSVDSQGVASPLSPAAEADEP